VTTTTDTSIHPIANLFPSMTGEEFEQLKASISDIGQLEPIVTLNGQVIDGRHRLRACIELGIRPILHERSNGDNLAAFVCARNLHRRHLSSSQRAALAVELLPYFEAEAALRQEDSRYGGAGKISGTGDARSHAAAATGTNARYVSDLKRLEVEHPELFEEVKHGPLSVADAQMLAKVRDDDRAAALELLTSRKARSAREAIELVFAERGEDVPARILSRPHRDVLIDELRRVLADGVRKHEEGDAAGAIDDLIRGAEIARQL